MTIFERTYIRIRQRFCNHELDLIYCSHYPTVYCKKCNKFLTSDINRKLGDYTDKLLNNKQQKHESNK